MKQLLSIFVCLICWNCGQADFCAYNFSINDLESSVIEEVVGFLLGAVRICTDTQVDKSQINFYLYTRTSTTGIKLNTLDPMMDQKNTTIVLIPGWLCNITNDLMPELKDAYLKKYDANVIIVDWAYYAARTYGDAYCRIRNIGKAVGDFLMRLETNLNITVESMHVLGHSMGGQIAGIAGGHLRDKYKRLLKRITGLDPAGPLFFFDLPRDRLDKSDANFVDVIHTNAGALGYLPRCGDVDYYPGCGSVQNGCKLGDWNSLPIDFLIKKIGCDHLRSVDYMIESLDVTTNKFKSGAQLLPLLPLPLNCLRDNSKISYMGEDSILSYKDKSYICDTNKQSPFAKG